MYTPVDAVGAAVDKEIFRPAVRLLCNDRVEKTSAGYLDNP